MTERIDKHILKNGMVILGERMEYVQSVSFCFMLPAGSAKLPEGVCGAANIITDWIFRGAGAKSSRELGDALDGLGLHRSSSVSSSHISLQATLEATNLAQALGLYADIIIRPHLKEDEFELAKGLAIDEVKSLDDDPRAKVMLKVRENFFPPPLGRPTIGKIDELQALTPEKTAGIVKDKFNPSQTIFTVAGKYDFTAVCKQMEDLFGDWQSPSRSQQDKNLEKQKASNKQQELKKYTHISDETAQVHIGLMTETVKPTDEDYYNAQVAVSVLSGGPAARLFTQVREKRGLCYAIGAQYYGLKEAAGIMCYAGTTPQYAQETLDIIIQEFHRLANTITQEEIARAKVGLKSSLILRSESSSSRATAIGSDYYILRRVRALDEIKSKIEACDLDSVRRFLRNNMFKDFTIVTIGPKKLKT